MEPTTTNVSTTEPSHAPRKLTVAENVILTIKILAGAALLMAVLWGANHWTSAK